VTTTTVARHFTVTGFVSCEGRTALHWHRLGFWLPPGGHVEFDEDPVQAMLREVREETGLDVELLARPTPFAYADPPQVPAPETIAVYDIPKDSVLAVPHQHIDFIYFTRPKTSGLPALPAELGWRWVTAEELRNPAPIMTPGKGKPALVKADVRELGLAAIAAAGR
jgi:8-oxo-dGTP pyrophosphatase MutT (NUDIX family)